MAALRQARGVGACWSPARWNHRRSLSRYLVATPRRTRRKVLIRSCRLLTVWMCSSPRTRSPADWFKTSWGIFIPVAQHAKAVPPSVTSRASLLRTGSSTALMASALSTGRTALTTAPLRSAATRIGTCSCDRPRFVALPPRPRAARSGSGQALLRAFPGPGALIAEQHEGFIGLDDAGQDRAGRRGGEKAVAPAKGGA